MNEHNRNLYNSTFSEAGHLPIERFLEIFEGLKSGKAYRPETMSDNYYHIRVDTGTGRDGQTHPYIMYTYHGSSAVQVTLDDLWWLIHVIFEGQDFVEFEFGKD